MYMLLGFDPYIVTVRYKGNSAENCMINVMVTSAPLTRISLCQLHKYNNLLPRNLCFL